MFSKQSFFNAAKSKSVFIKFVVLYFHKLKIQQKV